MQSLQPTPVPVVPSPRSNGRLTPFFAYCQSASSLLPLWCYPIPHAVLVDVATLTHLHAQFVLQMLFRGQIWWSWWPIKHLDVVCRKPSLVWFAVSGPALSCCSSVAWRWHRNRTIIGSTTSSQYRTDVRVAIVTRSFFALWQISPQTLTFPPPNLSTSLTFAWSKHSPGRHIRSLPLAKWRLNRDSSVNKTLFHCLLNQRWCAVAQLTQSRRWRRVSGMPT